MSSVYFAVAHKILSDRAERVPTERWPIPSGPGVARPNLGSPVPTRTQERVRLVRFAGVAQGSEMQVLGSACQSAANQRSGTND